MVRINYKKKNKLMMCHFVDKAFKYITSWIDLRYFYVRWRYEKWTADRVLRSAMSWTIFTNTNSFIGQEEFLVYTLIDSI